MHSNLDKKSFIPIVVIISSLFITTLVCNALGIIQEWYHLLIIYASHFGAFIVWLFIRTLFLHKKYIDVLQKLEEKDYNYVLNSAKLLKHYQDTDITKHLFCSLVAIAYLELGDKEKFLKSINLINHERVNAQKYFWLIIFYIQSNDNEKLLELREKYQACHKSPEMNKYDEILNILEKKKNNIEYSDEDIQIIGSIKSRVLKDLLI